MGLKVKFTQSHLNDLVQNSDSGVIVEVNRTKHLNVSPFELGNLAEFVNEYLDSLVGKYDPELSGIILSHRRTRVNAQLKVQEDGTNKLLYISDIYVFKPKIGSILTGVVNKKGQDHVGCLVHRVFNITIPRPTGVEEAWEGSSLSVGQVVRFKVVGTDMSLVIPYIRGELLDVLTPSNSESTDALDNLNKEESVNMDCEDGSVKNDESDRENDDFSDLDRVKSQKPTIVNKDQNLFNDSNLLAGTVRDDKKITNRTSLSHRKSEHTSENGGNSSIPSSPRNLKDAPGIESPISMSPTKLTLRSENKRDSFDENSEEENRIFNVSTTKITFRTRKNNLWINDESSGNVSSFLKNLDSPQSCLRRSVSPNTNANSPGNDEKRMRSVRFSSQNSVLTFGGKLNDSKCESILRETMKSPQKVSDSSKHLETSESRNNKLPATMGSPPKATGSSTIFESDKSSKISKNNCVNSDSDSNCDDNLVRKNKQLPKDMKSPGKGTNLTANSQIPKNICSSSDSDSNSDDNLERKDEQPPKKVMKSPGKDAKVTTTSKISRNNSVNSDSDSNSDDNLERKDEQLPHKDMKLPGKDAKVPTNSKISRNINVNSDSDSNSDDNLAGKNKQLPKDMKSPGKDAKITTNSKISRNISVNSDFDSNFDDNLEGKNKQLPKDVKSHGKDTKSTTNSQTPKNIFSSSDSDSNSDDNLESKDKQLPIKSTEKISEASSNSHTPKKISVNSVSVSNFDGGFECRRKSFLENTKSPEKLTNCLIVSETPEKCSENLDFDDNSERTCNKLVKEIQSPGEVSKSLDFTRKVSANSVSKSHSDADFENRNEKIGDMKSLGKHANYSKTSETPEKSSLNSVSDINDNKNIMVHNMKSSGKSTKTSKNLETPKKCCEFTGLNLSNTDGNTDKLKMDELDGTYKNNKSVDSLNASKTHNSAIFSNHGEVRHKQKRRSNSESGKLTENDDKDKVAQENDDENISTTRINQIERYDKTIETPGTSCSIKNKHFSSVFGMADETPKRTTKDKEKHVAMRRAGSIGSEIKEAVDENITEEKSRVLNSSNNESSVTEAVTDDVTDDKFLERMKKHNKLKKEKHEEKESDSRSRRSEGINADDLEEEDGSSGKRLRERTASICEESTVSMLLKDAFTKFFLPKKGKSTENNVNSVEKNIAKDGSTVEDSNQVTDGGKLTEDSGQNKRKSIETHVNSVENINKMNKSVNNLNQDIEREQLTKNSDQNKRKSIETYVNSVENVVSEASIVEDSNQDTDVEKLARKSKRKNKRNSIETYVNSVENVVSEASIVEDSNQDTDVEKLARKNKRKKRKSMETDLNSVENLVNDASAVKYSNEDRDVEKLNKRTNNEEKELDNRKSVELYSMVKESGDQENTNSSSLLESNKETDVEKLNEKAKKKKKNKENELDKRKSLESNFTEKEGGNQENTNRNSFLLDSNQEMDVEKMTKKSKKQKNKEKELDKRKSLESNSTEKEGGNQENTNRNLTLLDSNQETDVEKLNKKAKKKQKNEDKELDKRKSLESNSTEKEGGNQEITNRNLSLLDSNQETDVEKLNKKAKKKQKNEDKELDKIKSLESNSTEKEGGNQEDTNRTTSLLDSNQETDVEKLNKKAKKKQKNEDKELDKRKSLESNSTEKEGGYQENTNRNLTLLDSNQETDVEKLNKKAKKKQKNEDKELDKRKSLESNSTEKEGGNQEDTNRTTSLLDSNQETDVEKLNKKAKKKQKNEDKELDKRKSLESNSTEKEGGKQVNTNRSSSLLDSNQEMDVEKMIKKSKKQKSKETELDNRTPIESDFTEKEGGNQVNTNRNSSLLDSNQGMDVEKMTEKSKKQKNKEKELDNIKPIEPNFTEKECGDQETKNRNLSLLDSNQEMDVEKLAKKSKKEKNKKTELDNRRPVESDFTEEEGGNQENTNRNSSLLDSNQGMDVEKMTKKSKKQKNKEKELDNIKPIEPNFTEKECGDQETKNRNLPLLDSNQEMDVEKQAKKAKKTKNKDNIKPIEPNFTEKVDEDQVKRNRNQFELDVTNRSSMDGYITDYNSSRHKSKRKSSFKKKCDGYVSEFDTENQERLTVSTGGDGDFKKILKPKKSIEPVNISHYGGGELIDKERRYEMGDENDKKHDNVDEQDKQRKKRRTRKSRENRELVEDSSISTIQAEVEGKIRESIEIEKKEDCLQRRNHRDSLGLEGSSEQTEKKDRKLELIGIEKKVENINRRKHGDSFGMEGASEQSSSSKQFTLDGSITDCQFSKHKSNKSSDFNMKRDGYASDFEASKQATSRNIDEDLEKKPKQKKSFDAGDQNISGKPTLDGYITDCQFSNHKSKKRSSFKMKRDGYASDFEANLQIPTHEELMKKKKQEENKSTELPNMSHESIETQSKRGKKRKNSEKNQNEDDESVDKFTKKLKLESEFITVAEKKSKKNKPDGNTDRNVVDNVEKSGFNTHSTSGNQNNSTHVIDSRDGSRKRKKSDIGKDTQSNDDYNCTPAKKIKAMESSSHELEIGMVANRTGHDKNEQNMISSECQELLQSCEAYKEDRGSAKKKRKRRQITGHDKNEQNMISSECQELLQRCEPYKEDRGSAKKKRKRLKKKKGNSLDKSMSEVIEQFNRNEELIKEKKKKSRKDEDTSCEINKLSLEVTLNQSIGIGETRTGNDKNEQNTIPDEHQELLQTSEPFEEGRDNAKKNKKRSRKSKEIEIDRSSLEESLKSKRKSGDFVTSKELSNNNRKSVESYSTEKESGDQEIRDRNQFVGRHVDNVIETNALQPAKDFNVSHSTIDLDLQTIDKTSRTPKKSTERSSSKKKTPKKSTDDPKQEKIFKYLSPVKKNPSIETSSRVALDTTDNVEQFSNSSPHNLSNKKDVKTIKDVKKVLSYPAGSSSSVETGDKKHSDGETSTKKKKKKKKRKSIDLMDLQQEMINRLLQSKSS